MGVEKGGGRARFVAQTAVLGALAAPLAAAAAFFPPPLRFAPAPCRLCLPTLGVGALGAAHAARDRAVLQHEVRLPARGGRRARRRVIHPASSRSLHGPQRHRPASRQAKGQG